MKACRWPCVLAVIVCSIDSFAQTHVRFVDEPHPALNAVRRWAEITSDADGDEIASVRFVYDKVAVGPKGRWTIPAQYPPLSHERSEFRDGAEFSCRWGDDPCAVIVEGGDGTWTMWLADLCKDYSDLAFSHVIERPGGVEVVLKFQSAGFVRRGDRQKVGDVWMLRGRGNLASAYSMIPKWYAAVGQRPPEGHDHDKMVANVVYSTGMKGPVEYAQPEWQRRIAYDGGFAEKQRVIPAIAALGANVIWMRPVNGGYNPDDYYRIDSEVGTPRQFRDYVDNAHAHGLMVWHDAVPHGGSSKFRRFQEHPEWLLYRKDGKLAQKYWCADFNWPSWVSYMSTYAENYTRDYSLDGWRMDVPYGSALDNWNRNVPYARASYAKLQGGLNQQRGIRAGARRANPNAVTLGETLWNLHGNVADAVYDVRLCHDIFSHAPFVDVAKFVRDLRTRFAEQELSGFPGLVRMRYIESHDSLRAARMFGQCSKNLLFALTAFIPGMPMIYEEGEDGSFEEFRKVLAWRNANPPLVYGKTRWLEIDVPDGVLAFEREYDGHSVVVALNFNSSKCFFRDAEIPALGWQILGGRGPNAEPPFVYRQANGKLSIERSVDPSNGSRIYRFRNGERWFAKAADGYFESPWIVRHPRFENSSGFVYRLPLDATAQFDTQLHPFGFDPSAAQVGAYAGGDAAYITGFGRGVRVKVLDRIGRDEVLAVLVEGPDVERVVTAAASDVARDGILTGDERLRNDFCGWIYEDQGLKVRVNRHGLLMGVWRDGKKIAGRVELRTEEGKSGWNFREVRQGWDADTLVTFLRANDGSLAIRFAGETRALSRQYESRTSAPVAYVSTFSFPKDGTFVYETDFIPDEKLVVSRGIGFYVESEDEFGNVKRERHVRAGKFRREF